MLKLTNDLFAGFDTALNRGGLGEGLITGNRFKDAAIRCASIGNHFARSAGTVRPDAVFAGFNLNAA